MILSNEPGYYQTGAYGIRIENLLLVEERDIPGAQGGFMGFETLTHVPIDRSLLAIDLLSADERDWWNAYHAKVSQILTPHLDAADAAWLASQCTPLPR